MNIYLSSDVTDLATNEVVSPLLILRAPAASEHKAVTPATLSCDNTPPCRAQYRPLPVGVCDLDAEVLPLVALLPVVVPLMTYCRYCRYCRYS